MTRQHGSSLVELMIGTLLSMIVLTVLLTMFAGQSRLRAALNQSHDQIENGRFAQEILGEELAVAGYYAHLPTTGVVFSNPDPCVLGLAASGWSSTAPVTVPAPISGIGPGATLPCLSNRLANTAAIVVRGLDINPVTVASISGTDTHVQFSFCRSDPISPPFIVQRSAASFVFKNGTCTSPSEVNRYAVRVYFIAGCDVCGRDNVPTLKRLEVRADQLLVDSVAPGIEDMQFDYGFDLDGDGNPDTFRTGLDGAAGSQANDWSNVTTVRVHLLSRSRASTPGYSNNREYMLGLAGMRGPFADAFMRRVHSTTVRLRNPGGRREK